MVFRVVADLVYMNTSRPFIPMSWGIAIGVSFSFLVVHLQRFLLMLLSVLSKQLRFRFKRSPVLLRVWLTVFLSFMLQKEFLVSMVMFSTFEHSVDLLYQNVVRRTKEDCSVAQQLGVTCLAGYAAGSVGSLISNPADNIVASLYNKKADSLMLAVRKIGFINLFTRSLTIRILLVGPVVTLQWFFYDTIKVLSGLPTSGEVNNKLEVDRAARAHGNEYFINVPVK